MKAQLIALLLATSIFPLSTYRAEAQEGEATSPQMASETMTEDSGSHSTSEMTGEAPTEAETAPYSETDTGAEMGSAEDVTADDTTAPESEAFTGAEEVDATESAEEVQGSAITGTIERVWEDGFSINTGDGTTSVDAWDVCGDNTQQNIAVGDELTVEGRSEVRDFEASAITNADGQDVCSTAGQGQGSAPEQTTEDPAMTQ